MTAFFKILVLCLLLLTLTSCHYYRQLRGPCSFWPLHEDLPVSSQSIPQDFTSAEGRFRIHLPPTNGKTDAGASYVGQTFEWFIFNVGQYHITYSDRDWALDAPEVSESILNNFRNLLSSRGKLVVDSETSVSGHRGREFRVKVEGGTQIQRVFLAGNRYYVVGLFVSDRLECKIPSAVQTLDTFEITE